jgi:ketosteroid isomerase-like protein
MTAGDQVRPAAAGAIRQQAMAWILFLGAPMTMFESTWAGEVPDADAVMALDVEYQAAVERGDAATMDRILAEDFVLVTGAGKRFSKQDLIGEAKAGKVVYTKQKADQRAAKTWGDTAVVTALLHAQGTDNGRPFEYRVWYSDTYVRMKNGWRYVFGQSSLPLPNKP